MKSCVCKKKDNCVFILRTSSLEAIIIKVVNRITSIIEESKFISEFVQLNVIHFVQKPRIFHGCHYFLFHLIQLHLMYYFQIQKITYMQLGILSSI